MSRLIVRIVLVLFVVLQHLVIACSQLCVIAECGKELHMTSNNKQMNEREGEQTNKISEKASKQQTIQQNKPNKRQIKQTK